MVYKWNLDLHQVSCKSDLGI